MMRMGAWEVDFSGNVNAFVMNGDCQTKRGVGGVAGGFACGGDDDYNDIRDGLLPSWLNFSAATVTDGGWRTGVHLSFQPGTHTNSGLTEGLDGALGLSSVNFRQTFLTLGRDNFGTLKIGRDLGVFGSDAILSDMTLLGVGSGASNPDGHTTLGRIGFGYLYADWKAQLQYLSPNFNGLTFTGALVQPWGAGSIANSSKIRDVDHSLTNGQEGGQEKDTFGFEGKVNYNTTMENGSLGLWAGFIYQEADFNGDTRPELLVGGQVVPVSGILDRDDVLAAGIDFADIDFADIDPATIERGDLPFVNNSPEAEGFEIGTKIAFGDFDFVGYYYDGEGIGTTSFLLDGFDITGDERDADGYYLQARYRIPGGTLLGVSVGESNLDMTPFDKLRLEVDPAYNLVESNESWIIGAYHPVGEALNLVVEYTESQSEAHNGNENEEESLAIGAIMFF